LDHIDRLNRTIEYIEANLDKDIHLALLARKFALSKYHFHRIFKALIGEPPSKYIEERRLSRAAADLIETNNRIVDIEQTYDRIYGSWVPLTGNTPTMDLDIIVVNHRFKMQSNDSVIDILIPIQG